MNKKAWILGVISIVMAAAGFTIWQKSVLGNPPVHSLSKQEVQKIVQERFQGTVTQIKTINKQYDFIFVRGKNQYEIKMDASTGKIESLTKIESISQQPGPGEETLLSEDQIKNIVFNKVNGEVISIKKMTNGGKTIYTVIVQMDSRQEVIEVDGVLGTILSKTTKQINEPLKSLTVTEARKIAKKQVNGRISDISLEKKEDVSYFLVEIQALHGQKAVVQINAITGNVMSVAWDHD